MEETSRKSTGLNHRQSLLRLLQAGRYMRPHLLVEEYVKKYPEAYADLVEYLFLNEPLVSYFSAWALYNMDKKDAHRFIPYQQRVITSLQHFSHAGIQRNVYAILANKPLTEEQQGLLINPMFDCLLNPKVDVAIRVHAMQILANIAAQQRELIPELLDAIDLQLHHATPAFTSRARRVRKQLSWR